MSIPSSSERRQAEETIPTGVPVIDRMLHGGQLAQGMHCLMGPIGVGKSTLGTMIAAEGMLRQRRLAADGDTPRPWLFLTLDMSAAEIGVMAKSHIAKIDRRILETRGRLEDFSKPGQLRDYEQQRHEEMVFGGQLLASEKERFSSLLTGSSGELIILDMCDIEVGDRGTPAKILRSEINRAIGNTVYPAGIVIDYAGAAVGRVITARNLHPRVTSSMLRNFARECRELLAQDFGCPVWIVHQLAPTTCDRLAGADFHHRDAADCPQFGDRFDVCITLGTHQQHTGRFSISCTKSPREPATPNPAMVFIDPNFATIHEDDEYQVDPLRRQVTSTSRHTLFIDDETSEELKRIRRGQGGNGE